MNYLDMIRDADKYQIYTDIETLDMYIVLLLNDESKHVNHTHLLNLYQLINTMNTAVFEDGGIRNIAKYARYYFIKYYLEAKVDNGVTKRKLCVKHALERAGREGKDYPNVIRKEVLPFIDEDDLDKKDIQFINNIIFTNLNFSSIMKYRDGMTSIFNDVASGDLEDKDKVDSIAPFFQKIVSELTDIRRRSTQCNSFNLSDEGLYNAIIKETVKKIKSKENLLLTGFHGLNIMLNGGVENGRLYNVIGGTGGGKSVVLQNLLKGIKLANKGKVKRSPGKRSTILFVSQENLMFEFIQRSFNIFTTVESMKGFTEKQIFDLFKTGGFTLCVDDDDIDIEFRYYGNEDIGVSDVRSIIEELDNGGREVIGVIHDYIERVKPPNRKAERRIQLFDIANEMKKVAHDFDIWYITASQFTRNAMENIQTADGSIDIKKLHSLGAHSISESFGMMKNIDVNIIAVPVLDLNTSKFYMYFRKIKFRGEDNSGLNHIFQPYMSINSKIQLEMDNFSNKPVYKLDLNVDNMETVNDIELGKSPVARKRIKVDETSKEVEATKVSNIMERFKAATEAKPKKKTKINSKGNYELVLTPQGKDMIRKDIIRRALKNMVR
jgi:hypothetical protein